MQINAFFWKTILWRISLINFSNENDRFIPVKNVCIDICIVVYVALFNKPDVPLTVCPGHCFHDSRERCVCAVSRRGELHADRQSRTEKAGVPVPDELRQESAGYGHHGSQHVRQGNVA